jgi:hypothetical protein
MEKGNGNDWFEQFRKVILAYNEKRQPDPFMRWFKEKEGQGFFADDKEKVLTVLIDARFDQMTTAEKALANTKTVVQAGCLKRRVNTATFPVLIPRQYMTPEKWTKSFILALPCLKAISSRIVAQKAWKADELCSLMLHEIKTPYLGVKTTRLAIRWLYELLPALDIDMDSYEIPIDRLVYRVSCRLGLIDPNVDKYSGQGSDADVKIQTLVKHLLPGRQWIFDEPLWSTGRKPVNGGHCYPVNPSCGRCIFETICPRKFLDFDPAEIGMVTGTTIINTGSKSFHGSSEIPKETITPRQIEFAKFVEELKQKSVTGEEWRSQMSRWRREHPESV